MRNWKELNIFQKLIIGFIISICAVVAPELMLLLDVGGIELAFTFLLYYLKPALMWVKIKYDEFISQVKIAQFALLDSASFKPKVFVTQASFCCVAMLVTGSLIFSFSFLLPSLFLNGMLV